MFNREQCGYAAQLLYILSLCLAKFAVLLFLTTIAIKPFGYIVTQTIIIVNLVWAITAMIAIASQCSHPQPWAIISNNCFNQVRCYGFFFFPPTSTGSVLIASRTHFGM